MIDIHAHILPGIDDGAEDMYDTLEMARMAADSGVDKIIATPHCNIPGMYGNYFGREYIDRYESVVRAVRKEKIPIEILPGMEVFSTEDLPELIVNHKIMPLNQSRYILMEFAFDEDPGFADSILKRVEEVGARPVIAHAERYEFIQDYPQIAYRWFRKGYVIQANKGSFLGRFGGGPKRAADSLLRHNLISVIASDAHSPLQRTPYMLDAYEELSREYSENHLDVLFQYNPARLCDNRGDPEIRTGSVFRTATAILTMKENDYEKTKNSSVSDIRGILCYICRVYCEVQDVGRPYTAGDHL